MTSPIVTIAPPFLKKGDGIWLYSELVRLLMWGVSLFRFEVVYVDDDSRVNTLASLMELKAKNNQFPALEISRNFGIEAAVSADLDLAGAMSFTLHWSPTFRGALS